MTRPPFPPAGDVVIFQPQFVEFGGEERVILSLSNGLHAQGRAHSVLCYEDKIDLARFASQPLRVYQLKPPPQPQRRVRALRSALQRLKAQGNPVPVLFNIQAALHAGLGGARRYHLRIPDTYRLLGFRPDGSVLPPPKSLLRRTAAAVYHWGTRRGIQRADQFITNTRALADEMESAYGRRAEVLYLGGFGQPTAQAPQRANGPIQLMTVSRLQSSKRIDWVLESLAALKMSDMASPEFHLHVVGSGPAQAPLIAMTAALGLSDNVTFHGFVSDAQLAKLYRQAHVFLMPALQGYGLPAIEALYRRQGLILSEDSGVVEILGGTEWVAIARGSKSGFSQAMHTMLARVERPGFFDAPLPDLPSEAGWAQDLIRRCGW